MFSHGFPSWTVWGIVDDIHIHNEKDKAGIGHPQIVGTTDCKRRGTKEPLDEVKEKSENVGLKLNIQKTKIMVSGPIT